eukprot:scaffold208_cov323-Pavlova_lutheri.AAC.8
MRLANLKPRSGVVHDLNLLRPMSNRFRKEARKMVHTRCIARNGRAANPFNNASLVIFRPPSTCERGKGWRAIHEMECSHEHQVARRTKPDVVNKVVFPRWKGANLTS